MCCYFITIGNEKDTVFDLKQLKPHSAFMESLGALASAEMVRHSSNAKRKKRGVGGV